MLVEVVDSCLQHLDVVAGMANHKVAMLAQQPPERTALLMVMVDAEILILLTAKPTPRLASTADGTLAFLLRELLGVPLRSSPDLSPATLTAVLTHVCTTSFQLLISEAVAPVLT
jgi:hypothetical protein